MAAYQYIDCVWEKLDPVWYWCASLSSFYLMIFVLVTHGGKDPSPSVLHLFNLFVEKWNFSCADLNFLSRSDSLFVIARKVVALHDFLYLKNRSAPRQTIHASMLRPFISADGFVRVAGMLCAIMMAVSNCSTQNDSCLTCFGHWHSPMWLRRNLAKAWTTHPSEKHFSNDFTRWAIIFPDDVSTIESS